MKHKTKIEGVVLVKKEGNPDELKRFYSVYSCGKEYAVIAETYDLDYERDMWLEKAKTEYGFGIKINGGSIKIYKDIDELIKFIDDPHHKYTWVVPSEPLSLQTELTGHMYYGSPYETYDSCGNCDGARCETCNKRYIVYNWATLEEEFITYDKEAAHQYMVDNYLQEEISRAIMEISKEYGVDKDKYINFKEFKPTQQFMKLCADTGAIGRFYEEW